MKMKLFCVLVMIFVFHSSSETYASESPRRWVADDNRQIINDHRSHLMTKSNYDQPSRYSIRNQDDDHFSFVNNDPGYTVKANQRKIFRSIENPEEIYKNHPSFQNISKITQTRVDGRKYPYSTYSRYNERQKQVHLKRRYENLSKSYNEVGELRSQNKIYTRNVCIRCPPERTLIAAKGKEYVFLGKPKLEGCDKSDAPKNAYFRVEYGPRFGSRLKEGKHVTVGKIVVNNTQLQECQLRHNVVVRRCPVLRLSPGVEVSCPKNLAWGSTCRFKCDESAPVMGLHGPIRIKCKDDLTWSAPPPTCRVPNKASDSWCDIPPTIPNSRLNCDTVEGYAPPNGMTEGTICQNTCKNRRGIDDSIINPRKPYLICKGGIWHGDVPFCPRFNNRRNHMRRQTSYK